MVMTSPKIGVLYIRGLPRNIKAQFKGWCRANGLDMRDTILEFVNELSQNSPRAMAEAVIDDVIATQKEKYTTRTSFIWVEGVAKNKKIKFHAWCARRGITMTEAVSAFMRAVIKDKQTILSNASLNRLRRHCGDAYEEN